LEGEGYRTCKQWWGIDTDLEPEYLPAQNANLNAARTNFQKNEAWWKFQTNFRLLEAWWVARTNFSI
jgi:hypothetical protein